MEINFVTKNPHKAKEVESILGEIDVSIIHTPLTIHEIQTEDIKHIVRDKVLKAFNQVGRPVFIEHTGLYIDSLQGFPGGLTQGIFGVSVKTTSFPIFTLSPVILLSQHFRPVGISSLNIAGHITKPLLLHIFTQIEIKLAINNVPSIRVGRFDKAM